MARGGGWIPCPVASFRTYLGINLSWGQWHVCAGVKPGQSLLLGFCEALKIAQKGSDSSLHEAQVIFICILFSSHPGATPSDAQYLLLPCTKESVLQAQ